MIHQTSHQSDLILCLRGVFTRRYVRPFTLTEQNIQLVITLKCLA